MSDGTLNAFEVVPNVEDIMEDSEECLNEDTVVDLTDFKNQALEEGYARTMVECACSLADSTVQTYEDFERLINKATENSQQEIILQQNKERQIKNSIKVEIERLRRTENVTLVADKLIEETYNTTAVLAMDIVAQASDEELNLDLFEEPIYSVILQVHKPWVENYVNFTHRSWKTNDYVEHVISTYLSVIGTSDEDIATKRNELITLLPATIQDESSPDEYKQFIAVQLITKKRSPEESLKLANDIMRNNQSMVEYGAVLEQSVTEGAPIKVANAEATEEALEVIHRKSLDETVTDVASKAGALCGKAIELSYKAATTFDEMLTENAGEYSEQWKESCQKRKMRQEELSLIRAEQKQELKLAEINSRAEVKRVQLENRNTLNQQNMHRRDQTNMYEDNPSSDNHSNGNTNNGNFAPNLPPVVIALGVHLIILLFVWLIAGTPTVIYSGVGLAVATIGFLKQHAKEENAVIVILGGYVIFIFSIILSG